MNQNRVAVITGGCGQVGYATAKKLANAGISVISLVRKNLESAQQLMSQLPNQSLNHTAILASVTDTESIKLAVKNVEELYGRCDILINAAGINKVVPVSHIDKLSDELFDAIVDTNLKGTFVTIREFLPLMKKLENAVIVNISSTAAYRGRNHNMIYGAAKAGVSSLTLALARGLAPKIRVVAVAPGFLDKATSGIVKEEGINEKMAKEIPMARVGTGEDVAEVIESLVTSMNYVTGTVIRVDGGRLA